MKKILLIQLRQLGDILLTTPCIREIRRQYPKAQIDFLAHSMGGLILKDNPYLSKLITYSEQDGLRQQWRLMQKLRSEKYDILIDFMYNPRSALISYVSAAKRRIAFPSRRQLVYNEIVPQPKVSDYIVREKFHLLAAPLGVKPQSEALDLPWFEKDAQVFCDFSRTTLKDASKLRIALSPTHRRSGRQWPGIRYAQLADLLVQTYDASVIWLWGPGEKEFVEDIRSHCRESTHLSPPTSFREMAALLANCDLFIGNSNGPSHVAVSTDTPSLQLHGPTIAVTWCPQTQRHQSIQASSMGEIALEVVVGKVMEMRSIIENNMEHRLKNGDRMSWHRTKN